MKKKTVGGGRPRHTILHPQPSAMAYLCQVKKKPPDSDVQPDPGPGDTRVNEASNDGQSGTVAETSSDSDRNRRCHELTPNTTGQRVVLAENSCGLEPQEEYLEMGWTEAQVCIKCNKGGKLLVCSESNCPLAVHEDCMPCPARFDSVGNFYCSYCTYKRAMVEMHKARKKATSAKKALSVFLDRDMMNGDPQKQKAERDRGKEMKTSTAVGDTKADSRNRLDGVEADNHFDQIEEDQLEKTFDGNKDAKVLAVNAQNDVLSSCGHSVRLGDGPQHKVVIEEHTQPGPIIACGGGGTCCMEEDTMCQFTIVQVDKSAQAEHPKLVDDHENERLLQDKRQPDPLGATLVVKNREVGREVRTAITGELDNADVVKEHQGSRPEVEAIQDHERGDTLSSSGDDFMQQDLVDNSDITHGDNGYVSPHQRRIKRKNQNGIDSPSVTGQRQSARKLTKLHANVVNKEKKNATRESRHPKLPLARRKKLPWTTDEEEMLKEGVQKFSTMVNKNLPWKKILEFGRHVFDGTRNPADLKDKWRNILVKESSTK